jgi:hypothetical protein
MQPHTSKSTTYTSTTASASSSPPYIELKSKLSHTSDWTPDRLSQIHVQSMLCGTEHIVIGGVKNTGKRAQSRQRPRMWLNEVSIDSLKHIDMNTAVDIQWKASY